MNGVLNLPTLTIENLSNGATAVVVAHFVGFGRAYWNTPSGSAPDLATFRQGRSEIRTPLVVALPRIVRGSQSVSEHLVLAHEGKIGCVRFSGYVTPLFEVGARYVFFLYGSRDSTGALDDDLAVLIVWPVDDAGMVQTAHDGEVSLQDLEDRLKPAQP